MKKRVTGIGGFFFKAKDPDNIKTWYKEHLGIPTDAYGWTFLWNDENGSPGRTQWSPFREDTDYFDPSSKPFMMNFRVADLEGLMEELKEQGVEIAGEIQTYPYGKFGWILDPEGNKIELWEPPEADFQG